MRISKSNPEKPIVNQHVSTGKKGRSKEDRAKLKANFNKQNHHLQKHILNQESLAQQMRIKTIKDQKNIQTRFKRLEVLKGLINRGGKKYIDTQQEIIQENIKLSGNDIIKTKKDLFYTKKQFINLSKYQFTRYRSTFGAAVMLTMMQLFLYIYTSVY